MKKEHLTTILPVAILLTGVLFGRFLLPPAWTANLGPVITIALGVVVFCAGVDVGCKKLVLQKLREYKAKVLLVPFGAAVGSVLAGAGMGLVLGMPLNESAAISAGLGYYSISVGLFNEIGAPHLAALAFIANNLRETLSLLLIPLVARYIGHLPAVSIGGCTTMDVTLPVISSCTSEEVTIIAMLNGIILSVAIPLMVPLLYRL